jgi:TatD DNase family protein
MELIDIGCNLTHDSFDPDRDEVLIAAHDAGVTQLVVTGASFEGSREAEALARERRGRLFATAGVHPHHAAEWSDEGERLIRELLQAQDVVAFGETGLDYFRDFSPRPAQHRAFEAQLQLGVESAKPGFLHLRDAHEDFHAILKSFRDQLGDVVVHCFTGSREELYAYLDLDCHIGITGWICDERRGTHMKDYLGDIPASRLMIETDAPYLKPRNLRPRVKSHRNEPRFLPWVLGTLAAVRGEHPRDLARATTENARRFFRLPEDPGA